jgi:hypothetical protein
VSSAVRLIGKPAKPDKIELRQARTGILSRRQVSTIETIATTRGPASLLPMWIQFLRLCKSLHKRNYEQSRIRQSWEKNRVGTHAVQKQKPVTAPTIKGQPLDEMLRQEQDRVAALDDALLFAMPPRQKLSFAMRRSGVRIPIPPPLKVV